MKSSVQLIIRPQTYKGTYDYIAYFPDTAYLSDGMCFDTFYNSTNWGGQPGYYRNLPMVLNNAYAGTYLSKYAIMKFHDSNYGPFVNNVWYAWYNQDAAWLPEPLYSPPNPCKELVVYPGYANGNAGFCQGLSGLQPGGMYTLHGRFEDMGISGDNGKIQIRTYNNCVKSVF